MIKFRRYLLKNLARNPVRTGLTVSGVGLAAFIVVFLAAVFDSRQQAASRSAETVLVLNALDVY